jgi:hypothetical protein
MPDDKDIRAIDSWSQHDQGDDPGRQSRSGSDGDRHSYGCADKSCDFTGDYLSALRHHVNTSHQILRRKHGPHWVVHFPSWVKRQVGGQ